jgi:hypothetical protein
VVFCGLISSQDGNVQCVPSDPQARSRAALLHLMATYLNLIDATPHLDSGYRLAAAEAGPLVTGPMSEVAKTLDAPTGPATVNITLNIGARKIEQSAPHN